MKTKVTEFKTKRINKFTGGKIETFTIRDYPKSKGDDGKLTNSFTTKEGSYIGDYATGWWYFRKNLIVCDDYPHGLAILLNKPANKIEGFNINNLNFDKDVKAYYGYTHRGGNSFKIGDRLFNERYEPKEADYTKGEWTSFMIKRVEAAKRELKNGYAKTESEALKNIPISDVIPFTMRGMKRVENWDEAKEAAKNLSNYLS